MRTLHRDTEDSDFFPLLLSGRRPCDEDVPLLRREMSFVAVVVAVDFPLKEEDGFLLMVDDEDEAVPLMDDEGVVEGSTRTTL